MDRAKTERKLRDLQARVDQLAREMDDLDLTSAEGREQLDRMLAEEVSITETMQKLRKRLEADEGTSRNVDDIMDASERAEHELPGSSLVSALHRFLTFEETDEDVEEHMVTRKVARIARPGFRVRREGIEHGIIAHELRTLQTGTGAGSAAIGDLMAQQISERQRHVIGVRAGSARVVRTTSGNPIPFPTSDDTANTGGNVPEGTPESTASVDPDTQLVTLGAYDHSSGIIRVSLDFLMDLVQQDAVEYIFRMGTERIDKRQNIVYTKGDGNGKPHGFITRGVSAMTSDAAGAIKAEEILDLMHALDPAYATVENAEWHFNWKTCAAIKKVARVSQANKEGVEITYEAGRLGMPDRLESHRCVINQDMDDIATENKALAYGDMGQFVIRDVQDNYLIRMDERFGEFRQVGFLWIARSDSNLLHPTAVQYITQA